MVNLHWEWSLSFRTARGDQKGTALSFVKVAEMPYLEKVEDKLKKDYGKL